MNDLPVFGSEIQNSYLQYPSSEKHYIICGPKFGMDNEGRIEIIFQALYCGKPDGADYWCRVRDSMADIHFKYFKVEPNLWMRLGTRYEGKIYWQLALI